ncbi:MAG TPA: hypothetical protein PKW06_07065 [Cyclobacteriaceae bacterium]|nr:hypothetical protein [Cyclobacteriaceae bacterium]HPI81381.1 hypothetical protein [Cyclobacteriaceae bacterium]
MMSEEEGKPPLFSRWSQWYWLVMIVLAIQVIVYLFITNSF